MFTDSSCDVIFMVHSFWQKKKRMAKMVGRCNIIYYIYAIKVFKASIPSAKSNQLLQKCNEVTSKYPRTLK